MWKCVILLLLLQSSTLNVPAPPQLGPPAANSLAVAEQVNGAFAILSEFETLDTRSLPIVGVRVRGGRRWPNRYFGSEYKYGFLVSESAESIRVHYFDMLEETLPRSVKNPGDPVVTVENVSLSAIVEETCHEYKELREENPDGHLGNFTVGPRQAFSRIVEALNLARECQRRGARDLLDRMLNSGCFSQDFGISLKRDLDRLIKLRHANLEISREQIVKWRRSLVELFPGESESDVSRKELQWMEKAVNDESTDPRALILHHSSPEEIIAHWIFALRNQSRFPNFGEYDNNDWICDTSLEVEDLWHPDPPELPSSKLMSLGVAAVPALMAALDDETPTRCVSSSVRHFKLLTVADFAKSLLERILCAELSGAATDDKRAFQPRLEKIRKEGEIPTLRETVANSNSFAAYHATNRLLTLSPDESKWIIQRIQSDPTNGIAVWLCSSLSHVWNPAIEEFFLEEFANAPTLFRRARASEYLYQHGNLEILEYWKQVWRADTIAEGAQDLETLLLWAERKAWFEDRFAISVSVSMLLNSGQPDAIGAILDSGFLCDAVTHGDLFDFLQGVDWIDYTLRARPEDRKEVQRILELYWLKELNDENGRTGFWPSEELQFRTNEYNPRHCDVAAICLARMQPAIYHFDPTAAAQRRKLQLLQMQNQIRAKHGLELLPLPPAPVVAEPSPQFSAAVNCIQNESDPARRRALISLFDRSHMDSLPWLVRKLNTLPEDSHWRDEWGQLVDSMLRQIADVRIEAKGEIISRKLRMDLESLRGTEVDASAIIQLLVQCTSELETRGGYVEFKLERVEFGSGLRLTVQFAPGRVSEGKQITLRSTMVRDGDTTRYWNNSGKLSDWRQPDRYATWTWQLNRALRPGLECELAIQLRASID